MALIPQEQIPTDFDDEEQERDDLFIKKMIHDFRDEPPVEHDVYPESDDERNEDVPEREHIHIRRGDRILYKKQTFFNGVAFKECVLDYALRTGRNLTQYRYDKDKIGFKCLGGVDKGSRCPWQVYATILPNDAMWRTTVFVDKHTCIPSGDVDMFKVPVIARMFLDRIRDEPEYFMPLKIEETIKERFSNFRV